MVIDHFCPTMVLNDVLEKVFRDDIFAITSNFPRFKHVFRWLRSRAALEGYKLLTEDVRQNKITFLGCRCCGDQWWLCDKTKRKDCCLLSSVSTALIPDMCTFRGPAVLRKALDQFVSIKKNNVLLKMISWQGF